MPLVGVAGASTVASSSTMKVVLLGRGGRIRQDWVRACTSRLPDVSKLPEEGGPLMDVLPTLPGTCRGSGVHVGHAMCYR
jgi:hypothetical protein